MRKNLTFTLLFTVLLVFCMSIEKSSAQWVQAGPNGGNVALLAKDGTTLYAAVNTGLYTSTDNGNTWTIIQAPTWPGGGKALAKIGNYLFLASNAGIYRSADNGLTWVKKGTYGGFCLAANSTAIFSGTSGGVLRSTDNGETWTKVAIGSSRNQLVAVAATDAIVYSGDSYNGGVRQSTDNGLTWGVCSNGASIGRVYCLSIIGTDVYAGATGIWKYTNGTGSWTQTNGSGGLSAIVGDASVIFASSNPGVIRTTDGGATWTALNSNGITRGVVPIVMSTGGVYAGTISGVFRTQNNGDTWVQSDVGIKGHGVNQPAIATLGSDIFTATASSEVFRSSDLGQNWTNISSGLIPNTNPTPYTPFVGTDATSVFYDVSRSTNAGNSWTETTAPGRVGVYQSGTTFGNLPWIEQNGAYLTCDYINGISRSTDNGATWNLSMTGMTGMESGYYSLYSDGSRLYVGTSTGPYYSTDDGQSWTLGAIDSYFQSMGPGVYLSTGTSMLYGTSYYSQRGIFRSTDHGATWTQVLAASSDRMVIAGGSIYISGRTTDVYGVDANTLYRSDDDGQTWTNITYPVPVADIYTTSLAASGSNVFISTGNLTGRYIWGSNDQGATWHNVSQNIYPQTVASSIVILNGKVFANGFSLWSRNLSEFTVPAQPTAITGSAAPCIGSSQTYSVTNVYGVTYSWMFPAGWVVTAGGTTHSVTVTVGATPGIVLVTPTNMFGSGSPQFVMVTPNTNAPNQPGAITGATTPLEGSSQNYSVTNDPAVSYAWTFPAGWAQTAGGTTNAVTVTVGSGSGNITVTPSTVCGTGTARTLAVVPVSAGFTVTFNVDMSTAEGFDPLTDVVYLTGGFPGANWITPGDPSTIVMSRVGTTLTYTRALALPAGTYEYKYFKNAGWGGGEYAGGSNRSATISGATVVNDTWGGSINWANLQWPGTGAITTGGAYDVYAQAYIANGITYLPGATYGLKAWIGYSTSNTNPDTWTNWVLASFNGQSYDNDEFKADLGTAITTVGTYYYASRFQFGTGAYLYGGFSGTNGGFWDGTTNVSGVLNITSATKTLNLTGVLLEGLYAGGGNLNQAYDENGPHWLSGVADHITVELHTAADYGTIAYSADVELSTAGTATVTVPADNNGSYYITIKHRNSIETVSATAVSFAGSTISQSFGAPADVFGGNLLLMSDNGYAIYGGDVNQDGLLDGSD
ncbi:MAG: VPS10 domain-containing protein, partial [Bacteroidales bacterium]